MEYLPSKRFILVFFSLAIVASAIGWVIWSSSEKGKSEKTLVRSEKDIKQLEYLDKDADGDELKDWEELLWKTDAKNPDTDGDGTKDNDEVLAKRDPRKAGPDDAIQPSSTDMSLANSTASSSEENLTDMLARRFATSYFSRKIASASGGNTLEGKEVFANQIFTDITNTIKQEDAIDHSDQFSLKDFTVIKTESPNGARSYINSLGNLFKSASFPEKSDLEAISEAVIKQSRDLEGLKELQAYSDGYKKLAKDMKTITIPQAFLETHIAMANNFLELGLYMEEFINLAADPVKGMIALNGYGTEGTRSIALLYKVVTEIKTRNFNFSDEEGGSEFNKYLEI